MGARYPYYLLADSPEGQEKEAELARKAPAESPTSGDLRQGFVYERVPHITLKSIANNAEIDVIWERWQETLEPLRKELNAALDKTWEEWEIPRESGDPWPEAAAAAWNELREAGTDEAKTAALLRLNTTLDRDYALDDVPASPRDPWAPAPTDLHTKWWEARIARQQEIDASIAAKADFEYLYDRPYVDRKKVRVAGPFTVESISPHRVLGVDENDELIDRVAEARASYGTTQDFGTVILEHPQNVRRPAGPQGGPDLVLLGYPLAGRVRLRGRTLPSKAAMKPLPRSAPPSSSAPSSAPSPAPTSWPPPGRRPMPASTCWSPARSTTKPSPRSSRSSATFPSSRPG